MSKVTMKLPDGVTDVSFGGENFKAENALVTVPAEAVGFLTQYGFEVVSTAAAGEKADEKADEKATAKSDTKAK